MDKNMNIGAIKDYLILVPNGRSFPTMGEALIQAQKLTSSGLISSCCLLASKAFRTTRAWGKSKLGQRSNLESMLYKWLCNISSYPSCTRATMPSTFRLPCKSTQKFGLLPAIWLAEGSSSSSSVAPAPTSSISKVNTQTSQLTLVLPQWLLIAFIQYKYFVFHKLFL